MLQRIDRTPRKEEKKKSGWLSNYDRGEYKQRVHEERSGFRRAA